MSAKTTAIAFAVRLVAENTNLIRKPDSIQMFFDSIFGEETYDVKIARNIEEETARALTATKRARTNLKFKKIVKHV